MRVLLRADAGHEQGTGHVMRCLTLAEELRDRGHQVTLMTSEIAIGWLDDLVLASRHKLVRCDPDGLPIADIEAARPDWVIVDSYRIEASAIGALNRVRPVLAIVDGNHRGIEASLYLDQNLGAELVPRPTQLADRFLSGAEFALVRDAVMRERRESPWRFRSERASVLTFMGGTDPTRATLRVVAALASVSTPIDLTIVAPRELHDALVDGTAGLGGRILAPTPELPALLGEADVVISAAGTSAWDICALGLPAVLVAVVENQRASMAQAVARGLTLGIDAVADPDSLQGGLAAPIGQLLGSESLRRSLSLASSAVFDGQGRRRVVERMEREIERRKGETP